MPAREIEEQLVKYLADVHAIEEQALTQLRRAPDIAGAPELRSAFEQHLPETERQEQRVRALLEEHDADPSRLKDLAGKAGGFGMVVFAKLNPDTPGKLTAHAYSYEHMELAAYELLRRVAERAGDTAVATTAAEIADEERRMAERLASSFDAAVAASLAELEPDDVGKQLDKYLADAHAIEEQAIEMLEAGPNLVEDDSLEKVFQEHLAETREHERRIAERLEARGASRSRFEDAGMRIGALNLGGFFGAQPDTTAKLAGFAFAFEHLEIAAYELLRRVAERAGDPETADLANSILAEERAAASLVHGCFDSALTSALQAQVSAS